MKQQRVRIQKGHWFMEYLSREIGIEFKACMYFFVILFYYCTCRFCEGIYQVPILVLAEIIATTYLMGYIQVYLLANFDEGDSFGIRGAISSVFCSAVYTGLSLVLGWFGRNWYEMAGFFIYLICAYICMYLVYKIKRKMDTRQLNDSLDAFKSRRENI